MEGDSAFEVTEWSDLRKFNDEDENDWTRYEEDKMADLYGGKFIKVKHTSQGRIGYFCQLCNAESNARKSLEVHCGGMKHLKKKDLWEKEGKPPPEDSDPNIPYHQTAQTSAPSNKQRAFVYNKPYEATMRPPRAMEMNRRTPPREERYINWGCASGEGYDDYSRKSHERASIWAEKPSSSRDDPYPSIRHSSYRRSLSPVHRKKYDLSRDEECREKSLSEYGTRRPRYSNDDEYKRPKDTHERSRDRSPLFESHGRTLLSAGCRERDRFAMKRPSPPIYPKHSNHNLDNQQQSLTLSPAGTLLQKLAECSVKTEDDFDLALNIIAVLAKSMKEYSYTNSQAKISELLLEAELKIGTVKALKAASEMMKNDSSDDKPSLHQTQNLPCKQPSVRSDIFGSDAFSHPGSLQTADRFRNYKK